MVSQGKVFFTNFTVVWRKFLSFFHVILSSFINNIIFYLKNNSAKIQDFLYLNLLNSAKLSFTFFFGHSLNKSAPFELFSLNIGRLATVPLPP